MYMFLLFLLHQQVLHAVENRLKNKNTLMLEIDHDFVNEYLQ